MALNINTNIGALGAAAAASSVNKSMETAMERLSTGLQINTAADDAAGMAISSRMEAQVRGLNQAIRNAADGQSLIDTTEGAHQEVTNILQRMRELAVQSANDTNVAGDRANLQAEVTQLISEINRISSQTTWNGVAVLDGTFTGKQLQIGADFEQTLTFDVDDVSATAIGAYKTTLATETNATSGIAGDTLAVSGHLGSANVVYGAGASAKDIATAINAQTSSTGVSATATSKGLIDNFLSAEAITFSLNGTAIASTTVASTTDIRNLRDAINAISSSSGVTAAMGSSNASIVLTAVDGRDIAITAFTGGTAGSQAFDLTSLNASGAEVGGGVTVDDGTNDAVTGTVTGYVEMKSSHDFSFDGAAADYADADADLSGVSAVNITTADGAASAITAIDGAIEKINSARANLGAISNRLDNTISNLTNISTNISSSQSRIQDADFAAESTNLAKSQILQQAATAMLAQANASKQSVLSLLQG